MGAIKIVGICGSRRQNSFTCQTLKIALKFAQDQGAETSLIDLRDFDLPFCDGSDVYSAYPDVEKLRQMISEAHAIILATPEYHGSVSGVLKNALDLLEIKHVEHKVVALMTVLGGIASTNASNTLRVICRHLHLWVIPEQLIIPNADQVFNEKGEIGDPAIHHRMGHLVSTLIQTTKKLS